MIHLLEASEDDKGCWNHHEKRLRETAVTFQINITF
jgi:hypothetical protein